MPKLNWIKVSDRLPNSGQRVLTWRRKAWGDHNLGIHCYERNYAGSFSNWWIGETRHLVVDNAITHWHPLLEGPEEGEAHARGG